MEIIWRFVGEVLEIMNGWEYQYIDNTLSPTALDSLSWTMIVLDSGEPSRGMYGWYQWNTQLDEATHYPEKIREFRISYKAGQ